MRSPLLVLAGLGLAFSLPVSAAEPAPAGLIVQLRPAGERALQANASTQRARAERLVADQNAPLRVAARVTRDWHLLRPQAPMPAAELRTWAAKLRSDPRVLQVALDVREQRMDVTPSDTRYADQWWLQAVAAGNTGAAGFTTAWSRSTGAPVSGAGPIVAVLDSGITSHPELNSRLVPGYDFVSDAVYANDGNGRDLDPADPGDAVTADDQAASPDKFGGCALAPQSSWHGTLIAGQVAAVTNEGTGVAAANWNGRFMPVRVAGKCGANVSDIVDGLRWAAGLAVDGVPANPNPARVLVLSYGGLEACDAASATPEIAAAARLYLDTIEEVRAQGSIVIVAAGNQRGEVGRPGSCTGAFSVASLNREGYKSIYSNFGASIALATPGGDTDNGNTCDAQLADTGIVSTGNLGDVSPGAAGYAAGSGTSFAAPAVAGAASLMLAVNPALTLAQIEDGLKRSARPHVKVPLLGDCAPSPNLNRCSCTTSTCGAGVLDAEQALVYAAAPADYAAPARDALTLRDARIEACATLLGRPVEPAPEEPPPEPPPEPGGGGGGGAAHPGWLMGLAVAAFWLRRRRSPA